MRIVPHGKSLINAGPGECSSDRMVFAWISAARRGLVAKLGEGCCRRIGFVGLIRNPLAVWDGTCTSGNCVSVLLLYRVLPLEVLVSALNGTLRSSVMVDASNASGRRGS
eukprot:COSAG02_NODE_268_length_26526_cov_28.495554_9_plen_110_part_00